MVKRLCIDRTIFSFHLVSVLLAAIVPLASCSINYNQEAPDESTIPEFVFNDATFYRYENSKLSMALQAARLEQYKNDGASYARSVTFQSWNDKSEIDTEGSVGLLCINTKDNIYTLFNDIIIKNNEQKVEIHADNLKWNSDTEQLTSGRNDTVVLKRDDVELEGKGFSASGVSRAFSFTQPVKGTIETNNQAGSPQ